MSLFLSPSCARLLPPITYYSLTQACDLYPISINNLELALIQQFPEDLVRLYFINTSITIFKSETCVKKMKDHTNNLHSRVNADKCNRHPGRADENKHIKVSLVHRLYLLYMYRVGSHLPPMW